MQTKTPPELNRSGVLAIAWLPLAGGSIFQYASANPSRTAGSAADVPGMRIPAVSASPLGSKSLSSFATHLMQIRIAAHLSFENSPRILMIAIK